MEDNIFEVVEISVILYSIGRDHSIADSQNRYHSLTRRGFCPSACSLGSIEATAQKLSCLASRKRTFRRFQAPWSHTSHNFQMPPAG